VRGTSSFLKTFLKFSFVVVDEFIAPGGDGDDEEDVTRRTADHARLDRREQELDEQDLAQIASNLSKRYGRAAVRYSGDMNEVPQRLLMPSVHDASLWQVRVKVRSSTRASITTRLIELLSLGGNGT
jgi:predicted small metal-binding protein